MMFILKKLVSRFFFPLSLVIVLLLLSVFLKKRRRLVILAGVAILYLFSFSPFGYLLLRPLESQYQSISSLNLNKEVRWIVVLGGGSRADKALTPEDRLGDATLKRLLEGVRLSRLLPQARLVLSGGDYQGISPDAVIMQQVALDLGVARGDLCTTRFSDSDIRTPHWVETFLVAGVILFERFLSIAIHEKCTG